jgi:predicted dehydrogenase
MTKVAVVGAGNWGKNHVKTFFELHSLGAVVEPNKATQRKIKEQYENIEIYQTIEDVLTNDEIKGIVIATPVKTHFTIAKKALEAGKDVFIEKPITFTSLEGERLVKIANKRKCILMVGHILLHQPAIHFIKNYLSNGELGNILSMKQQRTKHGKVRTIEDVLWSFAVHDIAVMLYLLNEKPVTVSAFSQNILSEDIADDAFLHFTFASNVFSSLHVSWLYPEDVRKLIIVGSKGMLVYNEHDQLVTLHKKTVNENFQSIDKGQTVLFKGEKHPLKLECEHFLSCMKNRTKPVSDGENGVDVLKILERVRDINSRGESIWTNHNGWSNYR